MINILCQYSISLSIFIDFDREYLVVLLYFNEPPIKIKLIRFLLMIASSSDDNDIDRKLILIVSIKTKKSDHFIKLRNESKASEQASTSQMES